MHLLTVDTLEQAQNKIYSYLAKNELKTEKIALTQAFQYILAEDIHAPFAVPHFRRSTVDGYAIHSLDTVGAGESIPCFLKVLGAVEMGEENRYTVKRGECVYVPTGGMLPNGADAMLMIEYAEKFGENEIACYQNVKHNQYVVDVGEDIPEKSLVLEKAQSCVLMKSGCLRHWVWQRFWFMQSLRLPLFLWAMKFCRQASVWKPGKFMMSIPMAYMPKL